MKKITLLIVLSLAGLNVLGQTTCNNAVAITPGQRNATFAVNSQVPTPVCAEGQQNTPTQGIWYKYTATTNASLTINTNIPGYANIDTRVHIYTGTCGTLTCVGGDDDSGENYTSLVSIPTIAQQTYFIAFDNNWGSNSFRFEFTIEPPVTQMFSQQTLPLTGSYKICAVDMNGDFLDDLVGVNTNNIQVLYQAPNDSGFTTGTLAVPSNITNMPSWSMAAGDYNKDGYNDLVLGGGNGATLLLSNSTGTAFATAYTTPQYVFSQRTNFVDINNDGNLDVFVCHDVQPNVYFKNNGSGGFTFHQGGLGDVASGGNYGSIWVDYDNDGDQDLFIAKCRGGSNSVAAIDELHRNNGDGTFTNVAAQAGFTDYHQSWSAAWADFDNDGDMDVMIGASSTTGGSHKLMRNNGDGTFTNITAGSGYDTFTSLSQEHVAHDFDNDGYVDIFGGGSKIMFNNGNMTFSPKSVNATNGPVLDFNNDGFLDILNNNILKVNNGNANKWIKIHLKGTTSNSNGIGARVELYGSWGKQIRDVRSGDGFKYMSSLNTHFGIGSATAIDKVVIKWPSGVVDTVYNPTVNEALLVTEGSTLGTHDSRSNPFTVYPNPAKDFIEVSGPASISVTKARIYDMGGKLVKSIDVQDSTISVQSLSKGNYVLILKDTDGKEYTDKIIKN